MHQSVLDALMVIFHLFSQAASTSIAVPGLMAMPHSAYITFLAMEYSFLNGFVIIEATYVAIVYCEILLARYACFSFWLLRSAQAALHLCDFETVKLMTQLHIILVVIHFFVVANSAVVILAFTYWVRTL